ncbi:MAG: ABC transporter ATP-binding protein [Phycisphaeraceae bacterium]|nr:ABC transporter ATP-binding protein [Phycisphaeraceae bacterium]
MTDWAIRVHELSKRYRLGSARSMTDRLSQSGQGLWRRLRGLPPQAKPQNQDFWALRDVSFDVGRGEVVGIIGNNGAGKSTLLKVLSRITGPTKGWAEIQGRVGSLLEVGTGFHPELTGRENIYLNGATLGMRNAEISRHFDQIVEFSEIERFLDTPVKRYSSGMYVRLAFAVAAHLQPEILIVDEVLAVGDTAFQKKCLGKMGDVAQGGRTVLLVSHNMAAIQHLCKRTVVLRKGQVLHQGPTHEAIRTYLRSLEGEHELASLEQAPERSGDGRAIITAFYLRDGDGREVSSATCGQPITLVFRYRVQSPKPLYHVVPSFSIRDEYGKSLILHRSNFTGQSFEGLSGEGEFSCTIPRLPLTANTYVLNGNIAVGDEVADDLILGRLRVIEGDYFGSGVPGLPGHSPVLMDGAWACELKKAA